MPTSNCFLAQMDAGRTGFVDRSFDVVICAQNGISAFKVDPEHLVRESLRLIRPGGKLILTSYCKQLWPHRLEWFRRQSEAGLLGSIDYELTGERRRICTDGFIATTFSARQFQALADRVGVQVRIFEVDKSSLFSVIAL